MRPNDKHSPTTDSVDEQSSADQQGPTEEYFYQSTPEPAEDMIPASYLLKLLRDRWIGATDSAWMTGEVAANQGAVHAEMISSRIEQILDDCGHHISCCELGQLVSWPIEKGETPQEGFYTHAFLADVRPDDLHDEDYYDPLPY